MPNQTGPRTPEGKQASSQNSRLITAAWQLEQCRKQQGQLVREDPTEQNKANLEKVHRYYLRWEGSYNSALRQLRQLQTDRGIKSVSDHNRPESFAPLADLPKIERFAKRIARDPGGRTPRSAPDAPVRPSNLHNSTLCETKCSALADEALAIVGCGVNAPPVLSKAA